MSNDQYYALKSSLPMLLFDVAAPISSSHFLDCCESCLPPGKMDFLRSISLNSRNVPDPSESAAMHRYAIFEVCLRNTLTELRAAKLNMDAGMYVEQFSEYEPSAATAAKTVFSMQTDPLEKEHLLDRYRWDFLDSMEWEHAFDFEALCLYRCKLLILEKWIARQADSAADNLEAAANHSEKLFENNKSNI